MIIRNIAFLITQLAPIALLSFGKQGFHCSAENNLGPDVEIVCRRLSHENQNLEREDNY